VAVCEPLVRIPAATSVTIAYNLVRPQMGLGLALRGLCHFAGHDEKWFIRGANGLLSFSHLQVCNIEQPFLLAFVVIVVSLHVTSPVTSVTYVNTSSI
jgi:hypothetical protein